MTTSGADMGCERCQCHSEDKRTAILYTLLSQNLNHSRGGRSPTHQRCLCHQRRTVCLRTPHITCQAASNVLVKTVSFMKNLPSFHLLPREDQLLLLDSCWVPLFLLGLVQEMVTFEVMETPAPSMLKKILLDGQSKRQEPERTQPTLAAVQRLQCCLNTFWNLDLSPKEYAYLKGAILFNPGEFPALAALPAGGRARPPQTLASERARLSARRRSERGQARVGEHRGLVTRMQQEAGRRDVRCESQRPLPALQTIKDPGI